MSVLWMVGRYVDRQKRELLQYLSDNGACDAEHAIYLSGVDVKGASNRFILYAMGVMLLAFLVIMLW